MNEKELRKKFKSPPSEYSVYPFWFLNHKLDKGILKYQLKEMKQQGVYGFFIHARSGLSFPPYGSDEWFEIVKYIVEESKKLNLNSEIYDEFDCPSGTVAEIIPLLYPEYRAKFLRVFRKKVNGKQFLKIPEGRILKVFAIGGEKFFDITDKISATKEGFSYHLNWTSKYYYLTKKDYRHTRAIAFIPEVFVHLPYSDKWEVVVFYLEDEQKPEFTHQLYLDVLNPEATDMFIKYTHEKYRKFIGKFFGDNIHYFFTDEPKMFSNYPWTDKLEDIFINKYGYSLIKNLPHLVCNISEKSQKVRYDYRKLLGELFSNSFIIKIKKWCNKNNLALTGHISPEENIVHEGYIIGSHIDAIENFDIPGTDIIIPAVGDSENMVLNRSILMVSSVADRKGTPALCECFACSDWSFTPLLMKKITDWFFSLGINFVVPHAFFYSIDGLRKYEASPSQFYQWTFWKYYKYYSEYISRLSFLMQNTKPVVKIAFFYPVSTIWRILPDEVKAEQIDKKINDITFNLLSNHFYFHYITEKHIKEGKIEKGGLLCGRVKYSVILILKGTYIPPEIKIDDMKKKGIEIIEIEDTDNFVKLLEKKNLKSFEIKSSDREKIFVLEKEKGNTSFYFFVNISEKNIKAEIEIKRETGIEKMDCEDGRFFPLPVKIKDRKTFFNLEFSPFQSYVLSTTKKIFEEKQNENHNTKKLFFKEMWESGRTENYLILNKWKIKKGKRVLNITVPSPVYKIFPEIFDDNWRATVFEKIPAGNFKKLEVEYETDFRIFEKINKIEMVLEKEGIKGTHQIILNGEKLKAFKRKNIYDVFNMVVDITPLIKVGRNKLKIRLTTDSREAGIFSPFILKGTFSVREKNGVYEIYPFRDKLKTGSWVSQGFPFFSGTLKYRQKIKISFDFKRIEKIYLNFPEVRDTVEIKINGEKAGVLLWHPFKIEVKRFLREGENTFEFSVTNSNMNFLRWKKMPSGILKKPYLEFVFRK